MGSDARADLFCCGIVLAELILGTNFFEDEDPEKTHTNILEMQIPNFSEQNPGIDEKLNKILQKAFMRDREKRYQTAAEMLTELELYLYSDGYGPTNEKLADYVKELFV